MGKRPGERPIGKREVAYAEYIKDGGKYVTRSEMDWVQRRAFRANATLLETLINDFERHLDSKVWYRRLWRRVFGAREMTVADLPEAARAELERQLRESEGTVHRPEIEETIGVEDARAVVPTCVNCGSANLGPVNEFGGLKCNKCGAVKEEAPNAANIAGHIGGALGSGGAGEPTRE